LIETGNLKGEKEKPRHGITKGKGFLAHHGCGGLPSAWFIEGGAHFQIKKRFHFGGGNYESIASRSAREKRCDFPGRRKGGGCFL